MTEKQLTTLFGNKASHTKHSHTAMNVADQKHSDDIIPNLEVQAHKGVKSSKSSPFRWTRLIRQGPFVAPELVKHLPSIR